MISSWLKLTFCSSAGCVVGCVWNEASSSPLLHFVHFFFSSFFRRCSSSPPRTPCLFTAAVSPCDWLYVDPLRTGVTSTCVSELTLSMLRSVPAGPGGVVGVGVLCVVCCVCLCPAATIRPHRQPLSRRRADEQRLFISLRLSELNSGRI